MARDTHLQVLKAYIIKGWLHRKEDVAQGMQNYWPVKHGSAVIDHIAIRGKPVIMPSQLQTQILRQLHSNHIKIQKTRLFV